MRFRTKFAWVQVVTAILWLGIGVASIHAHTRDLGGNLRLVTAAVQTLLGCLLLVAYFSTWWEIGDVGLIQHFVWQTRVVPWNEIKRVSPSQAGAKVDYSKLEVDYSRSGPMSDRGTLLLTPGDRAGVLRELRARASQAEFDFPDES